MRNLSRNDPCWCGSGKKYKNCHMRKDAALARQRRRQESQQRRQIIIKTPEQIEGVRKASKLTHDILDAITEKIEVGVTTEQIDQWVHTMTVDAGAIPAPLNYRGFPKSICTSINEVICHGIPTPERVLQSGDILNVDVTSILGGYYGDSSRMFLIGDVSEQARNLVQVTYESMMLGIEAVRPGNKTGDIGAAIQTHAESHGYSVVRTFVGHGVGIYFHEPPDVAHYGVPGTGYDLVPGMIFTIEPMINIGDYTAKILDDGWTAITTDNELSAQWEHTMLVIEDGVDILTG